MPRLCVICAERRRDERMGDAIKIAVRLRPSNTIPNSSEPNYAEKMTAAMYDMGER